MTSFHFADALRLTKHHGLGNDFLVALTDGLPLNAPAMARQLCDRATGVGADGLIIGIAKPTAEPNDASNDAADAVYAFRLFNSDGSPAEISGNGLRCFGQAVAMHHKRSDMTVVAQTPAGDRRVVVRPTDQPGIVEASVEMGDVTPGLEVPADLLDRIAAAGASTAGITPQSWVTGDIGNPHIVFTVDDPDAIDLPAFGAAVEAVLGGINVHVVRATGPHEVEMRVWERGAGITQACGSGASVVAKLATDQGVVTSPVAVAMPGGSATVEISGDAVTLTGPAVFVAIVEVPRG